MDDQSKETKRKKSVLYSLFVGLVVAVGNFVFAVAAAVGIGMSSLPADTPETYFLGVLTYYLPWIIACSVPASVGLLLLFREHKKLRLGLIVSSIYLAGMLWFLFYAYRA